MSGIAIVGASSQIARDLIQSYVATGRRDLQLYVRDLASCERWIEAAGVGDAVSLHLYDAYGSIAHDAVINFVGIGDPRKAAEMGASIFDVTLRFDDMILRELERHPERRYLFLSSGAAYGNAFHAPVTATSASIMPINQVAPQDYYATAKLHAEVRHRSRPDLGIIDIRVFNYFSRTQDIEARFFITDILRAIRDGQTLRTSADYMVRDFLHPSDFHRLIECLLSAPPVNSVVDCYSSAPVDKPSLLAAMHERFGLRYESVPSASGVAVNATGAKPHYYSLNRKAAEFGYEPAFSSLTGVLAEAEALLARSQPA